MPSDNPTNGLISDDVWEKWQETVMRARRLIARTEQSPYVRLLTPIW